MKGIIMSAIMWMVLSIMIMGMLWVFAYEHTRNALSRAHKQALRASMMVCANEACDMQEALSVFTQMHNHTTTMVDEMHYHLMGFHKEPLLIRIKIEAKKKLPFKDIVITLDETMIQEVDYE